MIPLPEDISKKDVQQWLSSGWFYVKDESGTYQVAKLSGVDDAAEFITVYPLKKIEAPFLVPIGNVFPHWPECGALNLPGLKCAVFMARLQKKQWKRTYNADCVKLRVISDIPEHFVVNSENIWVVEAAFSPTYFRYSDVLRHRFPEGWKSCAISPNLIVMKPNGGGDVLVFLNGEIIGMISGDRFTCVNPAIKRRLLPFFDYMVE